MNHEQMRRFKYLEGYIDGSSRQEHKPDPEDPYYSLAYDEGYEDGWCGEQPAYRIETA